MPFRTSGKVRLSMSRAAPEKGADTIFIPSEPEAIPRTGTGYPIYSHYTNYSG